MPHPSAPEKMPIPRANRRYVVVVVLSLVIAATAPFRAAERAASPPADGLTIGVLFDLTGPLDTIGGPGVDGVRLALEHVNAAGGVLGRPVHMVLADGATQVETAVEAAGHLIRAEGADVLVGPLGSAATLAVVEQVSVPSGVPTLSPTATSPELSRIEDQNLLFLASPSDAWQASVLADLAVEQGYERLAVFYQDDIYGRALSEVLADCFPGEMLLIAIEPDRASYAEELRRAATFEAQAIVAIGFVSTAVTYVREARNEGLFDRFLFTDSTASPDLVRALGAEAVEGMVGTAPVGVLPERALGRGRESARAFDGAFQQRFERSPASGLEATAYDLTICACLAAERAGSTEGAAIRDALRTVCAPRGMPVGEGEAGVIGALSALRRGVEIDYGGASGALDWNDEGEIVDGEVVIWRFVSGAIVADRKVPFGNAGS